LPDEGPTAEAALVAREKRIALERAIGQLPEDFRATVVLLAQGRSYSEIATILGVSIGTVKSRISRASARLLVLLAEFRP
jgi:RNA polymerase sigma-70 factor (ECF subfamily)